MCMTEIEFSEIRTGDRIIVTPVHGRRFGIRVDHVIENVIVSGYQLRLNDPNVTFNRRQVLPRSRRCSIQRVEL